MVLELPDADKKMTFETWLSHVNKLLLSEYGVEIEDLPDDLYRDTYDDGLTPKDMVAILVYNNNI